MAEATGRIRFLANRPVSKSRPEDSGICQGLCPLIIEHAFQLQLPVASCRQTPGADLGWQHELQPLRCSLDLPSPIGKRLEAGLASCLLGCQTIISGHLPHLERCRQPECQPSVDRQTNPWRGEELMLEERQVISEAGEHRPAQARRDTLPAQQD
jgi:hypothetical protein